MKKSKLISKIKSLTSKSASSKKKAEQKKWVEYAISKNITAPFFQLPNEPVIRTKDGKAYKNPKDFFADGGNFNDVQISIP